MAFNHEEQLLLKNVSEIAPSELVLFTRASDCDVTSVGDEVKGMRLWTSCPFYRK